MGGRLSPAAENTAREDTRPPMSAGSAVRSDGALADSGVRGAPALPLPQSSHGMDARPGFAVGPEMWYNLRHENKHSNHSGRGDRLRRRSVSIHRLLLHLR